MRTARQIRQAAVKLAERAEDLRAEAYENELAYPDTRSEFTEAEGFLNDAAHALSEAARVLERVTREVVR